jgi:hypothetical protein
VPLADVRCHECHTDSSCCCHPPQQEWCLLQLPSPRSNGSPRIDNSPSYLDHLLLPRTSSKRSKPTPIAVWVEGGNRLCGLGLEWKWAQRHIRVIESSNGSHGWGHPSREHHILWLIKGTRAVDSPDSSDLHCFGVTRSTRATAGGVHIDT